MRCGKCGKCAIGGTEQVYHRSYLHRGISVWRCADCGPCEMLLRLEAGECVSEDELDAIEARLKQGGEG